MHAMRPKKNTPTKTQDKQVENLIAELRHRYDPLEMMSKQDIADRLKLDVWTVDHLRKSDPNFPKAVWVSDKSARWRSVDVLNWLSARPAGGWSPEWKRSALRASKRKPSREARVSR
jgi:predicted DNA-binding transcriptional regulator AlpA